MEVVLGMPFLALSNADVEFIELRKFTQRFYTIAEALSTTSWVELIDKKKFAKAGQDENSETFVIYVAVLKAEALIYPSQIAQIATLQGDKGPIEIPVKYSDYTDVFSYDLAIEQPENMGMNQHANQLIDGKQYS